MNCANTPSVISSLASESGATPFVLPDGQMIDPFGLVAALASLSHRQVKALGLQTSGISGRRGFTSSASADLASSLVSRLRAATASTGSTLYKLTWKERTTPARRSILPACLSPSLSLSDNRTVEDKRKRIAERARPA